MFRVGRRRLVDAQALGRMADDCIITASLIPLEIWEFYNRPNLGKAAVVVANAAIVAYLVWHVRSKGRVADPAAGERPLIIVK